MEEGRPGPITFAPSRGFGVAWQEFGSGADDFALVWGRPNHLESLWEWPSLARWLRSLAQFGRYVHFDQVGSGCSDRVAISEIPTTDNQVEDLSAVLDAADMPKVTLIGESEGACCAVRFAVAHPDRVDRLILLAPTLRGLIPDEIRDEMLDLIEEHWGEPLMVEMQFPARADDPRFAAWYGAQLRRSASPREARAMLALDAMVDDVELLRQVQAPTLVVSQVGDPWVAADDVRDWSALLPDGSHVLVPGSDRTFGGAEGESEREALLAIAAFLGREPTFEIDSRDRAILFTDIVGSTAQAMAMGDVAWRELLDRHDRVMAALAAEHGCDWSSTTGDGLAATLPGAREAVEMARRSHEELHALGIEIRSGVHLGHVELRGSERAGLDIHVAARVADLANAGHILVTTAARDALGAEVASSAAGAFNLKGLPGEWSLWSVV